MRSKGTETAETLEGDPPEDGGVSSSVPAGGGGGGAHWPPPQPLIMQQPQPLHQLLYINLEEAYPPSPPFLERDPNMSSAARYSPLHAAPAAPPASLPCLADYPMERLAPLLQAMEEAPAAAPFCPDGYPGHADLQLVVSEDGECHMVDGSGVKAEHVELLIAGGQAGVSYSLSSENGFIVARPTRCSTAIVEAIESDELTVDASVLETLEEVGTGEGVAASPDGSASPRNTCSQELMETDPLIRAERDELANFDIAEYIGEPAAGLGGTQPVTCILDERVVSRARASLPSAHLWLGSGPGVLARRRIPARARFGPLLGLQRVRGAEEPPPTQHPAFLLRTQHHDTAIDVSDEMTSNWMRYVRFSAGRERNLCLQQLGDALYFTSTRSIPARGELLLGYSEGYARRWGLPPPPPAEEEESGEWPCYECPMQFASSPLLQAHLDTHDPQQPPTPARRGKKRSAPPAPPTLPHAQGQTQAAVVASGQHHCPLCDRYFPRSYSLKRHLRVHEQGNTKVLNSVTTTTNEDVSVMPPSAIQQPQYQDNAISSTVIQQNQQEIIEPKLKMVYHTAMDKSSELSQHLQITSAIVNQKQTVERMELLPQSLEMEQEKMKTESRGESKLESRLRLGTLQKGQDEPETKVTFKCEHCNKVLADSERLEKHRAVHMSEESKPLACPLCPRRLLTASALAVHVRAHAGRSAPAAPLRCPYCPLTLPRSAALAHHVRSQHRRPDGQLDCPICDKRFPDYSSVRKHMRALHAARRLACSLCATAFSSPDKLRLHMLKHSDHREFLCPDCGKQFKRKDKLTEHIRKQHRPTNGSDRVAGWQATKRAPPAPPADPAAYLRFTFKCHPCRSGFKRRGMLVNHLARRHPEISRATVPELQLPILRAARDYFCQHCDKVYKSSSKRKAHILKNHPGEAVPPSGRRAEAGGGFSASAGAVPGAPHHCTHAPCHKQYASKAKLLQHIRNKHAGQERASQAFSLKENYPNAVSPNNMEMFSSKTETDLSRRVWSVSSERSTGMAVGIPAPVYTDR